MVIVQSLQWLLTTIKIPTSFWDFQTLHSGRHVSHHLPQCHLQSRYIHNNHLSDLVFISSVLSVSVSLFKSLLDSLPSQSDLHRQPWLKPTRTQMLPVSPPYFIFLVACVYFIYLFLISKLSSSLRGGLSWSSLSLSNRNIMWTTNVI